jgi:hypothetical protein
MGISWFDFCLVSQPVRCTEIVTRVSRERPPFAGFRVGNSAALANSEALSSAMLYLNVAGDRRKDPPSKSGSDKKVDPEYELECRLLEGDDFNQYYKFGFGCIKDRQFPVGLFSAEKPSIASAIFPGGKGAIDLVCLDGPRFWLFELKAGDNIPIGTLTELIFYTSIIRDAVCGRFQFGKGVGDRSCVQPGMLGGVKDITGMMLGHDLHPLPSCASPPAQCWCRTAFRRSCLAAP